MEKVAYIALPRLLFEGIRTYLRLEVENIHYVPRRGRVLVVSNHSGCFGLDAIMLSYMLHKALHRIPRILAHWSFLGHLPIVAKVAEKMGMKPATGRQGIELLQKNQITIIFPEGMGGSFKPSRKKYKLQHFYTGFIRMAILSKSPIIPALIIGAEESNINLTTLHSEKWVKGFTAPLPLNVIPFPAKWKIRFLQPVDLSGFSTQDATNKELMQRVANQIKEDMQSAIDEEIRKRKFIYFSSPSFGRGPGLKAGEG